VGGGGGGGCNGNASLQKVTITLVGYQPINQHRYIVTALPGISLVQLVDHWSTMQEVQDRIPLMDTKYYLLSQCHCLSSNVK
jgi:hypothetical protein